MKREDLKKEILKIFDKIAVEHSNGHQASYMNRYMIKSSQICFTFEKNNNVPAHIWCPLIVDDYVIGVEKRFYPACDLWKKINAKGKKMYGRHSAIKSTKELRDSDLVKYTPKTLDEVQRVVNGIKRA